MKQTFGANRFRSFLLLLLLFAKTKSRKNKYNFCVYVQFSTLFFLEIWLVLTFYVRKACKSMLWFCVDFRLQLPICEHPSHKKKFLHRFQWFSSFFFQKMFIEQTIFRYFCFNAFIFIFKCYSLSLCIVVVSNGLLLKYTPVTAK